MITKREQEGWLYLYQLKQSSSQGDKRSLFNDKRAQLRGQNNCKYICTQYWSTQLYKANSRGREERNSNTIPVKNFQYPFSTIDK